MNEQTVNTQPEDTQAGDVQAMITQPENAQPENIQPVYDQQTNAQPENVQPAYGQQMYAQPVNGQSAYGQQMYAQPVNGQPVHGQPVYGQQMNAQPVHGQPVYGQQMYAQQSQMPFQSMMSFPDALNTCFKKYIDFKGRASRAEFWWFYLLCFFVEFFCVLILGEWGLVLVLPLLVPFYAVGCRRLHDTGRTGWWQLLYLTILGGIAVLVFNCLPSQPAPNKYGDIPCKLQ